MLTLPNVDVCIATFRRPDDLGILLDSLETQILKDICMRIIIVDNDAEGSAAQLVQEKSTQSRWHISYVIQPLRGISYARNCALDAATAKYVAFLDDDEYVDSRWLQSLYDALKLYNADVVAGTLVKLLPNTAPLWVKCNTIYLPSIRQSGTILKYCATNNVLLSVDALENPPLRFDPAFALTGGSDTQFFFTLAKRNKKIVWCNEATAYEHVPIERQRLGWLLRRNYRAGQVSYRVFLADAEPVQRAMYIIRQITIVSVCTFISPVLLLASLPQGIQFLCKIATALGKISAASSNAFLYKEYLDKSYRS